MSFLQRRRGMMEKKQGDAGVLYALPSEKSFNGTSDYIDTGIQLMLSDSDFTIEFDATNGDVGTSSPVFHCMTEALASQTGTYNYPGLSFQRGWQTSSTKYQLQGANNGENNLNAPVDSGKRNRVAIVHSAGSRIYEVYSSTDGVENSKNTVTALSVFGQSDKNLLIGCYQTTAGVKGRWWNGVLHEFKILTIAVTEAAARQYIMGG